MKTLLSIFLIGILATAGVNTQAPPAIPDDNSVAIFRGVIEEMDEANAIVVPNDDQDHVLSSGDKVMVNLSVSDSEFEIGDEVVVYYTGELMESYPLQIDTVDVELSSEFDAETAGENVLNDTDIEVNELLPTAKIAINIEGFVTEINGNKITLDNGKTVIITEETAFETQNVGETVPINDEILVGNFIQGFTLDDETLDEVTALVINSNGVLEW